MTLRPPVALHEGFNDVDFRAPLLRQQGERGPQKEGLGALYLLLGSSYSWTHSGRERQSPGKGAGKQHCGWD
eukprot:bmy_04936T0